MKRSASGAFTLLLSFLLSIHPFGAALAGASVDSLSWTGRSSGVATNLHAVAYSTPLIWVAVGEAGTIIRSTDGGDTWTGVSNPTGDVLYGVAFHGPVGIAVGLGGTMLRSSDGGASWEKLPRATTKILFAVSMSATAAVAAGEEGTILHSSDDGATWKASAAGVANVFFGVGIQADTAIMGAYGGVTATSYNGGATWGTQVMGTLASGPAFYGACFATSKVAVVVGEMWTPSSGSLILRSENQGFVWTRQASPASGKLQAVCFAAPNSGVIVGTEGRILVSADTGSNWVQQSSGVSCSLNGVAFADPSHGIAVGDSGTVLIARSAVATSVESPGSAESSRVPGYRLEQNYPNPFNPVTKIEYTIGGNREQGIGVRDVSLIVYDVLGREVAVLVNETKTAGSYEVSLDGSRLASGIYIYRLTAGSYVQTMRMVLIK